MDVPKRYQFVRALQPGGMATVAVYRDTHLERDVVIKVVAPGETYRRAVDEIAALERVRSDYVVDVYDVLVDTKTREVGIVQACLPGYDLADAPPALLADATARLQILYQLADALREVHEAGVVHRDVKPENIRIVESRRLILFDFGLARDVVTGAQTAGFVGSLAYAAPELFASGYVQFTTAVDIYALAAVAYFLLNGRGLPPIAQRLTQQEPLILDDGYPPKIVGLLNRALSIDPAERPTAPEIRDALSAELLRNRHRALITGGGQSRTLSTDSPRVRFRVGSNELRVEYNGYYFIVTELTGSVFANNERLAIGSVLQGSSVLTFGSSGAGRTFVTFDVSNPEVLIQ